MCSKFKHIHTQIGDSLFFFFLIIQMCQKGSRGASHDLDPMGCKKNVT